MVSEIRERGGRQRGGKAGMQKQLQDLSPGLQEQQATSPRATRHPPVALGPASVHVVGGRHGDGPGGGGGGHEAGRLVRVACCDHLATDRGRGWAGSRQLCAALARFAALPRPHALRHAPHPANRQGHPPAVSPGPPPASAPPRSLRGSCPPPRSWTPPRAARRSLRSTRTTAGVSRQRVGEEKGRVRG